jgi:hypothetical protein
MVGAVLYWHTRTAPGQNSSSVQLAPFTERRTRLQLGAKAATSRLIAHTFESIAAPFG